MNETELKLEFLQPGAIQMNTDGAVSVKTVPYYIVAQALEGRYELLAGEDYADLAEGEAFLTGPDIPLRIVHHMNPESGLMRIRFIHFRWQRLGALDPLRGFALPLRLEQGMADRIGKEIDFLLSEVTGSVAENALRLAAAARILAVVAALGRRDDAPEEPPEWLVRVLRYIHRHRFEPVDPEALWKLSARSRSGFYREFRELTGHTPAEYWQELRLRGAAELLQLEPGLAIGALSARCGFANQFHFSRLFHARYGLSPGAFRRHRHP